LEKAHCGADLNRIYEKGVIQGRILGAFTRKLTTGSKRMRRGSLHVRRRHMAT